MKVFSFSLLALALLGGSVGLWYYQGPSAQGGSFRTAPVERGNLLATVSATGTVQAENVIDVGAQNSVPLQIKSFGLDLHRAPAEARETFGLPALGINPWAACTTSLRIPHGIIDFNSPVKQGQILAQLDEAIYQSQKDQAEAEVSNAIYALKKLEADLIQQRAKLRQATNEWDRVQRVKGVVSASEYDLALTTFATSQALVDAGEAALSQSRQMLEKARAALKQAETNLSYTSIRSPVDGIVIDRRVNVGQTVVSGLTASSLFLIAEDLRRLEVWASVNEADIGGIRKGQKVRFTVDAFPNEGFYGIVKEIRLNAQMTQNVVTYPVVVSVDNSSGRLLPYMTANLQFEVNQCENVQLISNAALRWRPQLSQVAPDARDAYAKSLNHRPAQHKPGDPDRKRVPEGTVWVNDGNHVRPVRVKLGLSDGNMTEVLGVVSGELDETKDLVIGTVGTTAANDAAVNNPFAPQIQQQQKNR